MLNALRTLLESKRAIVVAVTAVLDLLVLLGVVGDLDPALADRIVAIITGLGGLLVLAITATDSAKALTLPAGVGHKDEQP